MRRACLTLSLSIATLVTGCPGPESHHDGGGPPDLAGDHCLDNQRDSNETDVDCGGSCPGCSYGGHCLGDHDCIVGRCIGGACSPPIGSSTCADHVKDGTETDVDCGGGCPLCAVGKHCGAGSDCLGGQCQGGVCQPAPPPFSFADPRSATVGRGASGLVAGDWNGDGKLDAATSNRGSNDVSVLLGLGTGTFADIRTFAVGQDPIDLCAADLDGDGHLDLATADLQSSTVSILLGQGDGNFVPAPTPSLAVATPVMILARDLDGDGHVDLLVVDDQGVLWPLLGDGHAGFAPAAPLHVGGGSEAAAVGDWNGDQIADLAYVADFAAFSALGQGHGAYDSGQPINLGTSANGAWYVVSGDVDLDGAGDLVVTTYQGYACILRGDGHGAFAGPPCQNLGGAPQGGPIVDLDGDGRPDLALLSFGTGNIDLLRGHGDGTFDAAMTVFVGNSPQNIIAGDFDGDGKADLAICDYSAHDVAVLRNTHP